MRQRHSYVLPGDAPAIQVTLPVSAARSRPRWPSTARPVPATATNDDAHHDESAGTERESPAMLELLQLFAVARSVAPDDSEHETLDLVIDLLAQRRRRAQAREALDTGWQALGYPAFMSPGWPPTELVLPVLNLRISLPLPPTHVVVDTIRYGSQRVRLNELASTGTLERAESG